MRSGPAVLAVMALAALLAASALPARAQTGSLWHDQKINDMRAHEREKIAGTEAGNHYELALGHVQRIQVLLDEEDRSPRQEKKLRKAYDKAVEHLEGAVEAAPEWLDARMMLGAVHYKMKSYPEAKTAYEGALALDPDNESAKSYLASVNWYLERSGAEAGAGGGEQP